MSTALPALQAALATRPFAVYVRRVAVCAAVYGLLAWVGLQWAMVEGAVSPVWPAAGFALAALTLLGLAYWPFVPLGLLAASQLAGTPTPLSLDLAFAAGNALAAVGGTVALRRFRRGARRPHSVRLLLALLGAGTLAAAFAASAGTLAMTITGYLPPDAQWHTWLTWWLGDAAGIAVVAPLVLAWRRGALPPLSTRESWHLAGCLLANGAAAWLVFASPIAAEFRTWHVLPTLVWAALAFHVRGVAPALVTVAACAVYGATQGTGTFAPSGAAPGEALFYLQQYVIVMAVALLLLAELADERRGEARLAASEERYRLALKAVQGHVYDYDVAANRIRRSARFYDLLGYDLSQVPTTVEWWREQCEPGDYARMLENTRNAIDSGAETVENRYRARHADGHWVWVWDRTALVRDEDGRIVRAVGSVVDVTAEVEAAAALARSEQRYRSLVDATTSVVFTTDAAGAFVRRQPSWERYTGQSTGDSLGVGWHRAIHPDDRAELAVSAAEARAHSRPHVAQGRLWHAASGAWRAFELRAVPIARDGAIEEWVGTILDVEDRRRAAAELAEREQRFRRIADGMPQIVYVLDEQLGNEYVNAQWEAYTGQRTPEPDAAACVHPEDLPRLRAAWVQAREARGEMLAQFRLRGEDGRYRWFLTRARPVVDRDTGTLRWYGTSTDIDEQVRSREELQEADRRKDEFLATLAHELRNPLAPIRHATRILEHPTTAAADREWCRAVIRRQVEHMALLLDDLLDVSRITRGRLELKRRRVELRPAVDAAVETARPLIDARGHRLELRVPDAPIALDADPLRLAQVLANLLTNAAKYTDPGGRIELEARTGDGALTVAVRDSGIGLEPDQLSRIFEMFAQVEHPVERSEGGLGIGLALVRGLVELHGGTIEARSEGAGRGAEFIVRLPLAAGHAGGAQEREARSATG